MISFIAVNCFMYFSRQRRLLHLTWIDCYILFQCMILTPTYFKHSPPYQPPPNENLNYAMCLIPCPLFNPTPPTLAALSPLWTPPLSPTSAHNVRSSTPTFLASVSQCSSMDQPLNATDKVKLCTVEKPTLTGAEVPILHRGLYVGA